MVRFCLSFHGVPVPLPTQLIPSIRDQEFCHHINRCLSDDVSAYMEIQRSAEVDWRPSDTNERQLHYDFDLGSGHNIPIGVVGTQKRRANDNVATGRALLSCQVSWVVPAERRIMLDEAKVLMQIEVNERKEDVPPPKIVTKDNLAVEVNAEDD